MGNLGGLVGGCLGVCFWISRLEIHGSRKRGDVGIGVSSPFSEVDIFVKEIGRTTNGRIGIRLVG